MNKWWCLIQIYLNLDLVTIFAWKLKSHFESETWTSYKVLQVIANWTKSFLL